MSAAASSLPPFECTDGTVIDLSSENFDAIQAIDALLGPDADPEDVMELIEPIQMQMAAIDTEVLEILRGQDGVAEQSHQGLAAATEEIFELHRTMRSILEQASMTQEKVDAICKDIRAMDNAKRNLTRSITILENFGTLTDALAVLKETGSDSSLYKVNAPKLESALCLMEKFEAYQDIPKVQSLNEIVEVMTRGLHTQLMREIQLQWVVTDPMAGRSVDGNSSYEEKEAHRLELEQKVREAAPKLEAMKDAALMAQALERRTRTRTAIVNDILAKWITNLQVTRLDVLPESAVPLSDHFQGLFDWLQNILEGNRFFVEQWKAFPAEWKVQKKLSEQFCDAVKPHMACVLQEWAASGAGDSLDARSSELLQAWGATRTFEKRLMSTLEGIVGAGCSKGDRSYEDLKARAAGHLRIRQQLQAPESSVFDKRLREVFSEHLKVVIEWHSLELERAVVLLIKQDQANHWLASSGSLSRLDSARSLMLECRKQSENALPVLSQSVECVHLFAAALTSVLRGYVDRLEAQLPQLRHDARRDMTLCEVTLDKARSVCCLAGTARFFCENVPHLQRFIRERCSEADTEEVSLAAAISAFDGLASQSLKALDAGLMSQLVRFVDGPVLPGGGIQVMASNPTAWRIEQAGDTSAYAVSIASVLRTWGPVLYRGLVDDGLDGSSDDVAFSHVCSKVVATLAPFLLNGGILKLRKLSYAALTQLAIDLVSIKEALVRFPQDANAAVRGSPLTVRPAPPSILEAEQQEQYKEAVETKMAASITLVKLLQIADDKAFVGSYQQLLENRFQSSAQLQQVLMVADVTKDTVLARLNFFNYRRGAAALPRESPPPRPPLEMQSAQALAMNAQQWAAVNVNAMSARGAGVWSGMSSAVLTAAQGKALRAGTESFVGRSSALFSNVRDKLSGSRGTSSSK